MKPQFEKYYVKANFCANDGKRVIKIALIEHENFSIRFKKMALKL